MLWHWNCNIGLRSYHTVIFFHAKLSDPAAEDCCTLFLRRGREFSPDISSMVISICRLYQTWQWRNKYKKEEIAEKYGNGGSFRLLTKSVATTSTTAKDHFGFSTTLLMFISNLNLRLIKKETYMKIDQVIGYRYCPATICPATI